MIEDCGSACFVNQLAGQLEEEKYWVLLDCHGSARASVALRNRLGRGVALYYDLVLCVGDDDALAMIDFLTGLIFGRAGQVSVRMRSITGKIDPALWVGRVFGCPEGAHLAVAVGSFDDN